MDIYGDYKYLFFMCGAVTVTGGVFLFVMNIYNYYMLDKEKLAKDRGQNPKTIEDQVSNSEMKPDPEAEMERTEPEAKEKNGAQRDPVPENVETPN